MEEKSIPLPSVEQDKSELALAARYAPRILFDRHEPFLPQAVGYTIFREDGYSPSFPRCIGLGPVGRLPAEMAIEYAIWWDWDIGHLYELEHVWTYVDGGGEVVHAEGSWHGNFGAARLGKDGRLSLFDETHPVAYSQAGKHAFAFRDEHLLITQEYNRRQCTGQTKKDGLLITPIFEEKLAVYKTPEVDHVVNAYLERHSFEPAFAWDQVFDVSPDIMIPWPVLADWIPKRIRSLLNWLQTETQEIT